MFENAKTDLVAKTLRDLIRLVRRMREFQRVNRMRESISQSARRCDSEDQVDNFLALLLLEEIGPSAETAAPDGQEMDDPPPTVLVDTH